MKEHNRDADRDNYDEYGEEQKPKKVDAVDAPNMQEEATSSFESHRRSGSYSSQAPIDARRVDLRALKQERKERRKEQRRSIRAEKEYTGATHSNKRRTIKWVILGLLFLAVAGCVSTGAYFYNATQNSIVDGSSDVSFLGQVRRVVDEDFEPLKGEEEDRINVLLLGQGGVDHPGGTLADTIMVASIKPSTNEVGLLSLPRDLVIPHCATENCTYPEYRKINYILHLGDGELDFAYDTIKTVTGLDVHYYMVVDFAGFREFIDTLGGVTVNVENPFTDYQYPDYNYGWQTITFAAGEQEMDGETALQFARSRHGNNGEGSDFARAKRQQIIMEAVREKALSASTLLNPTKMSGIMTDLGDHVSTNMEIWEMLRFAKIAEKIDRSAIVNHVVDNSENGLLNSEISSETGAYVLLPRAGLGDYSEIQELAVGIFHTPEAQVNEETAVVAAETPIIVVQNGSGLNGLASSVQEVLLTKGFAVKSIGNALVSDRTETIIYDLSGGSKPETAAGLAKHFGIEMTTATLPSNPNSSVRLGTDINTSIVDVTQITDDVDFIIILGKDRLGTTAANSGATSS